MWNYNAVGICRIFCIFMYELSVIGKKIWQEFLPYFLLARSAVSCGITPGIPVGTASAKCADFYLSSGLRSVENLSVSKIDSNVIRTASVEYQISDGNIMNRGNRIQIRMHEFKLFIGSVTDIFAGCAFIGIAYETGTIGIAFLVSSCLTVFVPKSGMCIRDCS